MVLRGTKQPLPESRFQKDRNALTVGIFSRIAVSATNRGNEKESDLFRHVTDIFAVIYCIVKRKLDVPFL